MILKIEYVNGIVAFTAVKDVCFGFGENGPTARYTGNDGITREWGPKNIREISLLCENGSTIHTMTNASTTKEKISEVCHTKCRYYSDQILTDAETWAKELRAQCKECPLYALKRGSKEES